MRFQWPWRRDERVNDNKPGPPLGDSDEALNAYLAQQVNDTTSALDREALAREINQVKRVNDYLLTKALARGWITEEQAVSLRTTQAWQPEHLGTELDG